MAVRERALAAAPGFSLYLYALLRLIPDPRFESTLTAVSTKCDRYHADDRVAIRESRSPLDARVDMPRDREDSRPMSIRVGCARAKMSKIVQASAPRTIDDGGSRGITNGMTAMHDRRVRDRYLRSSSKWHPRPDGLVRQLTPNPHAESIVR